MHSKGGVEGEGLAGLGTTCCIGAGKLWNGFCRGLAAR